jgi:hypothetical protein
MAGEFYVSLLKVRVHLRRSGADITFLRDGEPVRHSLPSDFTASLPEGEHVAFGSYDAGRTFVVRCLAPPEALLREILELGESDVPAARALAASALVRNEYMVELHRYPASAYSELLARAAQLTQPEDARIQTRHHPGRQPVGHRTPRSAATASTYVLELSVGPGAWRWAEVHTYPDTARIRLALERFCSERSLSGCVYLDLFHDAILGIWTVQKGALASFLELRPFLTIAHPTIGAGRWADEDLRRAFESLSADDAEDLALSSVDELVDLVEVGLDWKAIEDILPRLDPPLLTSDGAHGGGVLHVPDDLTREASYVAPPKAARPEFVAELEWGSQDKEGDLDFGDIKDAQRRS